MGVRVCGDGRHVRLYEYKCGVGVSRTFDFVKCANQMTDAESTSCSNFAF